MSYDGTPSTAAITASALTKRFGAATAVHALNFDIPRGTVCGFVGPNGAGKTTTIRMLLGLSKPSAGTATVLGHPIEQPAEYLLRVGAMIEGPAFHPALSGRRNLHLLASAGSLPTRRVAEALDRVGLTNRANSPVRDYSLGMKQRLGIAAALLPEPDLLILDEPTNGLDPAGIAQIRELIRGLADGGRTVFVSSHLLAEIEQIAGHVLLLQEGRLLFSGPMDELLQAQRPHTVAVLDRAGELPVLVAALRANQLAFDYETDGSIRVRSDRPALVNRIAHEAGLCLAGVYVIRPSLEDAFFAMTSASPEPAGAVA